MIYWLELQNQTLVLITTFNYSLGKKNPALNVWASLLQNLPCKVHFYASLFLCLHKAVRFTSFLCLWFSFHYVACIKDLFANSLKHPSTSPLKHLISQQSMHIATRLIFTCQKVQNLLTKHLKLIVGIIVFFSLRQLSNSFILQNSKPYFEREAWKISCFYPMVRRMLFRWLSIPGFLVVVWISWGKYWYGQHTNIIV